MVDLTLLFPPLLLAFLFRYLYMHIQPQTTVEV